LRERSALGFIELSVGRPDACTAWLDPLRLKLTAGGYVEPGLYRFLPDQVEALVQLGQTDTAEEVLAPFESAAVRLDRRWAVATARRCRGLISSARGDQEGAVDLLKESLRLSENLGQPFEVARTALALGTVARRGRRRSVARDALRHAVDLFERLGPGRWAERARRELDRVGLRPSSSNELTETELRITELVATGRRNPEIARVLFMSRKTVEAHLTSMYRKLGIHSRAELAAHATTLAARSDSEGQI
jgi:DNA-binding CsgD family transcriptional regulator